VASAAVKIRIFQLIEYNWFPSEKVPSFSSPWMGEAGRELIEMVYSGMILHKEKG
jgi:hypothetical protein